MTEHKHDTNRSAMVARRVEGWDLYRDGEDQDWIRDLDLATQAGLAKPRDIRETIARCIADDLITQVTAASTGRNKGAYYRVDTDVVPFGKGGSREVATYYLSEDAALHVIMRLRTPVAVQLQRSVVQVFLAAKRGLLTSQAAIDPLFLQAFAEKVANDVAARFMVRIDGLESAVAQLRIETAATNDVILPHAEHPERWAPTAELRDAHKRSVDMLALMKRAAAKCSVRFPAVHGKVRAEFGVPGYRRVLLTQADTVQKFVDALTADDFAPKKPEPVVDPSQVVIDFAKAKARNSNAKKSAG